MVFAVDWASQKIKSNGSSYLSISDGHWRPVVLTPNIHGWSPFNTPKEPEPLQHSEPDTVVRSPKTYVCRGTVVIPGTVPYCTLSAVNTLGAKSALRLPPLRVDVCSS